MVFHSLNHDRMLQGRRGYLHTSGVPDSWVGYITITGDFIGGIHDNHPLLQVIRQHAGYLSQHGRLAHAGTTQQQDTLTRLDKVFNDLNRAKDSPAHPAGKPNNASTAVADSRNAVQGTLNPGTVIVAKAANAGDDIIYILFLNLFIMEHHLALGEAGFGEAAQVQNNLQQSSDVLLLA
jgi:hypothetical protein